MAASLDTDAQCAAASSLLTLLELAMHTIDGAKEEHVHALAALLGRCSRAEARTYDREEHCRIFS